MTPDDIASGTLFLGYAMTVAASQGMTCDTSLLYGHGANAFSTYPGLTRDGAGLGGPGTPPSPSPSSSAAGPR
ncbi:hypothetical protein [Streptomyces sp. NPDC056049]|uniref:hypothetical protein n=1 Tax=Streptomyces sp. NPDC056049 TaxID=3345693 RepID=UPI0035D6B98E